MIFEDAKKLFEKYGLNLDEEKYNKFCKYEKMLVETNKVMNLTGIVEENEVYEKHFYDSLLFSFCLPLEDKSLVDVGTGAGFPGLVLAICYPLLKVSLVEPLTKKCNFLNKVINELELTNVEVINSRSEDLSSLREKFDYATARAVARLNILCEIIAPLLKVNGTFIALKGKQGEEELLEASNALKKLNLSIDKIQKVNLLTDNDERINIFLKLDQKIDAKYPRNFSQIKKKPL